MSLPEVVSRVVGLNRALTQKGEKTEPSPTLTNMELGKTQEYVLMNLSFAAKTPDQMGYPRFSENAVRSALDRLWRKGLVERRGRLWEITDKGLAVLGESDQ